MSEIHLQPKTIGVFNNRPDYRSSIRPVVQVNADVLSDFEFAVWWLWFAGHAKILYQPFSIGSYPQTKVNPE